MILTGLARLGRNASLRHTPQGEPVVVSFRVIAHPEPVELGRLCEMIQQEVELSLIEPTEEQQQERKEAA